MSNSSKSASAGTVNCHGINSWIGHWSNQNFGMDAGGRSITSGLYNLSVGSYANHDLNSGNNNIAIGYYSLDNNEKGNYLISVGTNTRTEGVVNNSLGIGHGIIITEDNIVIFGSQNFPYSKFLVNTPTGIVDLLQSHGGSTIISSDIQ